MPPRKSTPKKSPRGKRPKSPQPLQPQTESDPSGQFDYDDVPFYQEFMAATEGIAGTIVGDDFAAADTDKGDDAAAPSSYDFPPEFIAKALRPSFEVVFNAVAARRGDHWKLHEFETDALVEGWTPMVQHLLSKLGSTETQMLTVALMVTGAVVGGKAAQEGMKRASSTANTKTPESAASSASSASAEAGRQPAPEPLSEMPVDA